MMSSLNVPVLFINGSGDETDRIAHAGGTKIFVAGASCFKPARDAFRELLDLQSTAQPMPSIRLQIQPS